MIAHFPDLYDDETFYSGCARYVERTPWQTSDSAARELFGKRQINNMEVFPTRLGHFVQCLHGQMRIGTREIIEKHTLIPFITSFLDMAVVTQGLKVNALVSSMPRTSMSGTGQRSTQEIYESLISRDCQLE